MFWRFLFLIIFSLLSRPALAKELGLKDCFRLARDASYSLKSTDLDLHSAGLSLQSALSPFYPVISASGSEILSGDALSGARISAPVQWNTDTYGGSLNGSWNLFSTFHDVQQARLAVKNRSAAEAGRQEALQDLAVQVVQAYYDLLKQRALTGLSRQTLRQRQDRLKQAEELYANGTRAYSNLLSARALAKSAELGLSIQANQAVMAETRANALFGRPLDEALEIADAVGNTPAPPTEAESLKLALDRRPNLRRLQEERESRRVAYELAWQGNLPYVSLDALATKNLGRYGQDSSLWSHAGQADENATWALTASVNYTFFQGFGIDAQVGKSRDSWTRSAYALDQALRDARVEVRQACLDLEGGFKALEISRALVEAAGESLKETQRLYDKGMASMLEATDAEVEAVRARMDQLNTLYDYLINLAKWRRTVGQDVIEGEN